MNRDEFKKLILPLSEKEIYYRDHPEKASEFWDKRHSHPMDDVFLIETLNIPDADLHGHILYGRPNLSPYRNITFNKQTRYSEVPLHRHNYLELFYVYSGHCSAIINDTSLQLDAGDVCIMDTHTIHTIEPTEENDIILNCVMHPDYFNTSFIGRLSSSGTIARFLAGVLNDWANHDHYLLFHTAQLPVIQELFENAFCEYLDPGICSKELLDNYMASIFILLARCYQTNKEREYHKESRSYLTEILRYIENNHANCTLQSTAAKFNFHPNYLSRAIKKSTGFSFKELVLQTRLRQAAFLLLNSTMPVSEVALECGWSNQNEFYKKFYAKYGCTPKQYRSLSDVSPMNNL